MSKVLTIDQIGLERVGAELANQISAHLSPKGIRFALILSTPQSGSCHSNSNTDFIRTVCKLTVEGIEEGNTPQQATGEVIE